MINFFVSLTFDLMYVPLTSVTALLSAHCTYTLLNYVMAMPTAHCVRSIGEPHEQLEASHPAML